MPTNNKQGGHLLMDLTTGSDFNRGKVIPTPITDTVKQRVEAIAKRQGIKSLKFEGRYGKQIEEEFYNYDIDTTGVDSTQNKSDTVNETTNELIESPIPEPETNNDKSAGVYDLQDDEESIVVQEVEEEEEEEIREVLQDKGPEDPEEHVANVIPEEESDDESENEEMTKKKMRTKSNQRN